MVSGQNNVQSLSHIFLFAFQVMRVLVNLDVPGQQGFELVEVLAPLKLAKFHVTSHQLGI